MVTIVILTFSYKYPKSFYILKKLYLEYTHYPIIIYDLFFYKYSKSLYFSIILLNLIYTFYPSLTFHPLTLYYPIKIFYPKLTFYLIIILFL